jgi:hypothetical protein
MCKFPRVVRTKAYSQDSPYWIASDTWIISPQAAQEAMNESDRRINGRIVGAITRAAERPEHYNEERELMPGEAGMLGLYQPGGISMLSQNFGYLGGGRVSSSVHHASNQTVPVTVLRSLNAASPVWPCSC